MDIKDDVTIQSWDGTWTYRPKVLVTPQTPEDIVEIVKSVVRFPSPVRPAGSMHSTARMNGDDGGTMVDMKAMNRILKFGEDTVTVEGGVSYQTVSNALKERGLQFHVMTEIGNVTLAAMATAATKDSSFPGEYGQISSYVTAMRFVTPQGDIRAINERDHPEEMQVMRSSYGLLGIVFEVTIRVRPTTALSVRHHSMGLEEFRKRFPVFKAQGYAVMYYIFPYARCVVVELRKDNPEAKPVSRRRWAYRNRFWRKYGPALSHWIRRRTSSPRLRAAADDLNFYFLRQGLVRIVRHDATWPHAQHINYPRNPGPNKYIFSMWAFREGGFFKILEDYCDFCTPTPSAQGIAATCRASVIRSRRTATRCCLIAGTAPRSPSTLPRPAARNGRTSCAPTTISVARAAESRCSTRRRSSPKSRRRRPLADG